MGRPPKSEQNTLVEKLQAVWVDVVDELDRAMTIHPRLPVDPLRRVALISEEAGESLKAALDLTRGGPSTPLDTTHDNLNEQLYAEVTQTAAMALLVMMAMREER